MKKQAELKMLRQVNPLLINDGVPVEVFERIEEIYDNKDLGREGYIALWMTRVENDVKEILDALGLELDKVDIPDDNLYPIDIKNKEHFLTKECSWNSYYITLHDSRGKIYVVYPIVTIKE